MQAITQQSVIASPSRAPRVREEKNKKFANDGSYASVENLLRKVAYRCFARVQAMGGIGMTFDDVFQEMNISYLMALKTWTPDGGALFSTYLTTSCYRNFNERIRRSEVERRNLGLVNLSDMRRSDPADGDDLDLMEIMNNEDAVHFSIVHLYGDNLIEGGTNCEILAAANCDPAELIEHVQEAHLTSARTKESLGNLTQTAKLVVADLLRAARTRDGDSKLPKFSALLRGRGFSEQECKRIRREVVSAFGVRV
jgi:DNA-directed RNA polymerase specialized sigma24 family protein